MLISVLGLGGTYWLVRHEMLRAVDERLVMRMEAAVSAIEAGEGLPDPAPGQSAALVETERPDGFDTRDVGRENHETRFLLRSMEGGQILLGEDVERQEELRDILAAGMQLSLLATLFSTVVAGLWLAHRGQSRLDRLNAGLVRVASGSFDQPIALEGTDDLALLANRIDLTTERLGHAMTQLRVQSSNIAHDLRTPLARLRGGLESSLTEVVEHGRRVDPDVLDKALEEIDRITGTFEALLRLSRIESGAGRDAFRPVDLRDIVEDVSAAFGPVVEDAGQSLEMKMTAPETVDGDRDMLIQLVANLIQNALRYGADEQIISLQVHGRRMVLSDQGPGIPFEDRDKVLLPLYQSETTRQNAGFGLGLSLVNAIAGLHDATLVLSDGPHGKGLEVTVEFPKLTKL
ncbi:MAG: HAMP domain-containing sensor histidine kinase [Pseudomonadota bacterium]